MGIKLRIYVTHVICYERRIFFPTCDLYYRLI